MLIKNMLKQTLKNGVKEHMANSKSSKLTQKEKNHIKKLVKGCVILVLVCFLAAFYTQKNPVGVIEFLGIDYIINGRYKEILVGLVSSFVFGIMDNGGIYFGMDALEPIFKAEGFDEIESAGWGNTFSNFMGAFTGTFIGILVQNLTGVEETPLWTEVVGILFGCIVGIYLPRMLLKKTPKCNNEEQIKESEIEE